MVPSARTYLREHVPRTYEHLCGPSRGGEGYGGVRTLKSLRAPQFYAPMWATDLLYILNPASQNFAR